MRRYTPTRRSFVVGGAALLGGCMGGSSRGTPDPSSFERITVEGAEVPLAPVDTTYQWFQDETARFVDARGPQSYELSHIEGAVSSPAPAGGEGEDPVASWSKDERIVCYCGCPHHLSSLRASTLLRNGYENVYVIDEGFWEWQDRGYPVVGTTADIRPTLREIRGRTDASHAGESAWAWHEPTGQREATPIDAAGEYLLELRFADVTLDSTILIETPAYRLRAPLGDLLDRTVTGGE